MSPAEQNEEEHHRWERGVERTLGELVAEVRSLKDTISAATVAGNIRTEHIEKRLDKLEADVRHLDTRFSEAEGRVSGISTTVKVVWALSGGSIASLVAILLNR